MPYNTVKMQEWLYCNKCKIHHLQFMHLCAKQTTDRPLTCLQRDCFTILPEYTQCSVDRLWALLILQIYSYFYYYYIYIFDYNYILFLFMIYVFYA